MTPILTSKQSHNAEVMKDILFLYGKAADRILDMTYGEGKFWTGLDTSKYDLVTNDLFKDNPSGHHFDFRRIDLLDESFDLVVLDPPYIHGAFNNGNKTTKHKDIAERYGLKPATESGANHKVREDRLITNWGVTPLPMNANGITKMYRQGMAEAWRLLKPAGILVIKTQDEIESGKQVWRHVQLAHFPGYQLIDLFVVTQIGKPLMRHKHQKHARKNHSYFMVFRKEKRDNKVKLITMSTKESLTSSPISSSG